MSLEAAAWTWKQLLIAGVVVATLLVGGYVAYKIFIEPGRVTTAVAEGKAKASEKLGDAQGKAGAGASNTVATQSAKETIIYSNTRDHYHEITKQPGAGDPVPPAVWDAFRRSVCLRESAAHLPDCQQMPAARP